MMKKYILLLSIALFSCGTVTDDHGCQYVREVPFLDCEYPGGIIFEKHDFKTIHMGASHVCILYKNKRYSQFAITAVDEHYKVGDTIKGTCLNN